MADGVRATQTFVEQLTSHSNNLRTSQVFVEQLISKEPGDVRVTQMFVEVLRSRDFVRHQVVTPRNRRFTSQLVR